MLMCCAAPWPARGGRTSHSSVEHTLGNSVLGVVESKGVSVPSTLRDEYWNGSILSWIQSSNVLENELFW